ncbi:hypothetical protein [Polyangium spumosum]|uniref:Uncharacterized protein n=1 Tax=Polyangium spumosum TaxID=889282 RepID=A0A6N7PZF1_9BACT|nr:hypothetical protein [Polyangium spumosum]MRG96927.1 hypothetical protein [Polyangium spumosum]
MRSSNVPLPALLASLGVVVGGCSAPVADDVASATGSTTEAIVLVERSVAEGEFVQTNVSAKFMRLASGADPEVAERVVGGSWLELPAAGECVALTPFAAAEDADALAGLGTIELLDVGDLSIQAGTTRMPLATRAFPDVGAFVSGVFYTSRDAQSDLPAPARYVLESTGSATLNPFAIEADAPSAPEQVRLGEAALADGLLLEEEAAATLRWTASEAPAVGDLVYVDLTDPSGTGVRCAYNDSGEGVIPESVLGKKTWGALPAQVALSVHRIRQGGFAAAGVDAGELRFDLSVVVRATIVAASP